MNQVGKLEKLLILLISAQKQAELAEGTSPVYRQYTKQILNAWSSMTRSAIREMKKNIQDPNAEETLNKWAFFFLDALDELSKADDKPLAMKILQEFNKGTVEFTDTDLKTTCVNFGRMCQKEPNKSPAWIWLTFEKQTKQKREKQSAEIKKPKGRPNKFKKYDIPPPPKKKRGRPEKKSEPIEAQKGICRNCDNLRTEMRKDDLLPWCTQGVLKFTPKVRIDYEAPEYQRGCDKFKEIPKSK